MTDTQDKPILFSIDWVEIKGRGTVATFKRLPEGHYDPSQLMHKEVLIDGLLYKVRGVETTCTPAGTKEKPYNNSYGLLVDRVDWNAFEHGEWELSKPDDKPNPIEGTITIPRRNPDYLRLVQED